jgi:RimJ/RimL family protein N-acetyltransferase
MFPRHVTGQPTLDAGWFVLRPFLDTDAEWVRRVSSDPVMQHFVGPLPDPYELQHARGFIQFGRDGWESGTRAEFVAEEKATGRQLCRVGTSLTGIRGEVGYWSDPTVRGKGVTTEALRRLCEWAFVERGLLILEWRAEVGNDASRRVAEKVGFRIEATLRGRVYHREVLSDAWVGSLLRAELT